MPGLCMTYSENGNTSDNTGVVWGSHGLVCLTDVALWRSAAAAAGALDRDGLLLWCHCAVLVVCVRESV